MLSALAPEQAAAANDALRVMADCAGTPLVEALCFRQIAHSAEPLEDSPPEMAEPIGGILGTLPRETVH